MKRLSLKEIAAEFRKSTKTFRKYVKEYKIPHIRLGRSMLFDLRQVELHLATVDVSAKPQKRRSANVIPIVTKYDSLLGM